MTDGKLKGTGSSIVLLFFANTNQFNPTETPFEVLNAGQPPASKLLQLSQIADMEAEELNTWIDQHYADLAAFDPRPEELIQLEKRPAKIEEIIANSDQGKIEHVVKLLCEACRCDFDHLMKIFEHGGKETT